MWGLYRCHSTGVLYLCSTVRGAGDHELRGIRDGGTVMHLQYKGGPPAPGQKLVNLHRQNRRRSQSLGAFTKGETQTGVNIRDMRLVSIS
jgi:hypothetical protein